MVLKPEFWTNSLSYLFFPGSFPCIYRIYLLIKFYLFFSCWSLFYYRSLKLRTKRVQGKLFFLLYGGQPLTRRAGLVEKYCSFLISWWDNSKVGSTWFLRDSRLPHFPLVIISLYHTYYRFSSFPSHFPIASWSFLGKMNNPINFLSPDTCSGSALVRRQKDMRAIKEVKWTAIDDALEGEEWDREI